MRRLTSIALAILACATLTACNRGGTPESNTGSGASASATETPSVISKSGVGMISIPGGSFTMGSDQGNPDEQPAHHVTVTGFLMDKYPVTHEMFAKAQVPNPSHWQENPHNPVESVRWRDAKSYCNERSRLEGLKPCYDEKTPEWDCDYTANGYRLPTEAEWEYAAKAGTDGPYDFGSKDDLREYAWFADNSEQKTHPVGEKKPNKWGLYDMYGDVSVWCEDVYDPNYYKSSPAQDPHGPASPGKDVKRALRGGNWKATADMCRATFRQGERTGDTDACFHTDFCGLRCVRRASPQEIAAMRVASK